MTITANNLIIFHIDTLDNAVTQLSLRGYKILRFDARNKDEMPRIEIDRPYEGKEQMFNPDKTISYCEEFDVRIFWRVETKK